MAPTVCLSASWGVWAGQAAISDVEGRLDIPRNAHRLAGMPGVIAHGRRDMGCPVRTAWELAQAWPGAWLHVIEDAGHAGSDAMGEVVREAVEEFKHT